MNKLIALILFSITASHAQHTFSIVAVDPITKEVGSAGATCLSVDREGVEALIISDIIPGRGAINTQSYYHGTNQYNANVQLNSGKSPNEVIDWLRTNDVQRTPEIRQYGIAALDVNGIPSAAGFTGNQCLDFKLHKVGSTYSIQGNILIGNYVIDSMEARFLRASGSLADRLLEGMKGALIAGADSRCLNEGISSRSSFLRVAKPNDPDGSFYLDIHVPSTVSGLDPIDSLSILYDEWKQNVAVHDYNRNEGIQVNYDEKSANFTVLIDENYTYDIKDFSLFSIDAKQANLVTKKTPFLYTLNQKINSGVYIGLLMSSSNEIIFSKKILIP